MLELYGILFGTLLLSGIIRGVYTAFWHIFGFSNACWFGNPEKSAELGILPTAVIQAGLFLFLSVRLELTADPFMKQVSPVVVFRLLAGFGALLSLECTMIRQTPDTLRKLLFIELSDVAIGAIAGGLFGSGLDIVEGGIVGGVIGLIEILLSKTKFFLSTSDKGCADLFPFWITAWIAGTGESISFLVFWGVVAFMVNRAVPPLVHIIGKVIAPLLSPICVLLRFKTIHCDHCFRYTSPLRSKYFRGRRYCEHCQKQVEYTQDPGKLIVTFGNALPSLEGRVFLLPNPDFEQYDHPIDVTEIYLDPDTCERRLLEKCITYLLHTPPKYGFQSVKVFYTGELERIGGNLKNVLRNNFEFLERFTPIPQQSIQANRQKQAQCPEEGDSSKNALIQGVFPQWSRSFFGQSTLSKLGGAISGGIVGVLSGAFLLGVLMALLAEIAGSIVFESPLLAPELFCVVWIVFALLAGMTKGVQEHQRYAQAAVPLLVVVVFLALLAAIAVPNLVTAISKSNRSRTAADIRALGTALGSYLIDHEYVPTTHENTVLLSDEQESIGDVFCNEGYYCGSFQDAWNRPLIYVSDGISYTLMSYGKDKRPGGNGEYGSDIVYVNGQFTAPSSLVDK